MEYKTENRVSPRRWFEFLAVMFAIICMPVMIAITVRYIIPWESQLNYVPVRETEPVTYETLIIGTRDVLLISDNNDTIHLKMINAFNLASEWEIQIQQKR